MPFALIVIGLLAVMSAIKGTQNQLGQQIVSDFTGQNSFLVWLAAIFTVGILGYVPQLQKFSRAMLALVILSIILHHGGFFDQLYAAIQQGPQAPSGDKSLSAQTQSGSGGGLFGSDPTGIGSLLTGASKLLSIF